jgi:type II restriction enzyme
MEDNLTKNNNLSKFIRETIEKNKWKSNSRINGEACEEYAKTQLNCSRCGTNNFEKCKINEKSIDLICNVCKQNYQIKSKKITQKQINNIKNTNSIKILGGEYLTTLNNINKNIDYIIILYESNSYEIKNILYIKSENIIAECILPRNPLKSTAQRAGWRGCNILFNNVLFIK